jgi:MORN repeat
VPPCGAHPSIRAEVIAKICAALWRPSIHSCRGSCQDLCRPVAPIHPFVLRLLPRIVLGLSPRIVLRLLPRFVPPCWALPSIGRRSRDALAVAGEWKDDKRHGYGVCKFADGTKFRGEWEDDGWVQSAAEPELCRVSGAGVARATAGREAAFGIEACPLRKLSLHPMSVCHHRLGRREVPLPAQALASSRCAVPS